MEVTEQSFLLKTALLMQIYDGLIEGDYLAIEFVQEGLFRDQLEVMTGAAPQPVLQVSMPRFGRSKDTGLLSCAR